MAPQPECVIALAFGYRRSRGKILPGPSNEDLAEIVHRDYSHLPKILQFEVADAFDSLDHEPVLRIERHRTGSYLDTHEVLLQAAALCKKSGWETVAVVAHPLHLDRVVKVLNKLGLATDTGQLDKIRSSDVRYDRSSEQSWTRSEFAMRTHEAMASALYKAMHYI